MTQRPGDGAASEPRLGAWEAGREAEFLKILLDNIDVGVSILDADMRYRLISDTAYRNMKVDPARVPLGATLRDCHEAMIDSGVLTPELIARTNLAPEDNDAPSNAAHTRRGGRLIELADGTVHHHIRKPLPGGMLLSVASDVSHIAEKDSLLDGALALGRSGYWTYCFRTKTYKLSEGFRRFLGRERSERVHTRGILSIVEPEDRDAYRAGIESLKHGETRFSVETRNVTGKGRERWARTTIELQRDPAGRPLRLRAFVQDTTEAHHRELELERLKDEAVAASLAKSEFLANMSHEIRTPMNGVLGMAELLAASAVDERQREYINVINSSASALLNIINDILDYSKIEAGALEIDPLPFNLADCIADITGLLSTSAQAKGLELIVDYPADQPRHLIGDAGRIRQVLTNLVGNAVKFTENGYVKIGVNVRRKGPICVVSVEVTDTGIGIAPAKLPRVFDKFTQADGSTTRVYGGTGLGLAITRNIVEMMDGRINATSELGKGSTFAFRLPLPVDTEARIEEFDTGVLAGRRALVVDDIDVNCTVLRRQLAAWDIEVDCAHDGIAAIEALRSAQADGRPYDLMLLDYLMPGINGRDLATMITARTDLAMPPTVMLSSCDQPVSSRDLARSGIDSYLVKPVRERRLYDTVVRVLSNPAEVEARRAPQSVSGAPTETAVADAMTALHGAVPQDQDDAPTVAKTEVLVAEDFHLNRDVVRLMLQATPFEPVFAENGRIAVDMFTAEPDRFPLIVMDVSMPVMDGHMATREIRDWEQARGRAPIPVIALTGHAMKTDQQEAKAAGMDDFLTKPVKQGALLEKLEHYSGRAVNVARVA